MLLTLPQVHNEAELKRILPIAKAHGVPVTFRAAGTSLSGQALTDSVLLKLSHTGKNFRNYTIHVSMRRTQEMLC
jgi:D-lactate dehydrogenase